MVREILKATFIFISSTLVITLHSYFNDGKGASKKKSEIESAETASPLLLIKNLSDFYYAESGFEIEMLTEHAGPGVTSISVYRYGTAISSFYLQDSIILNRKGIPVMRLGPGWLASKYYYDADDNMYLELSIAENKYDSLYTLKRSDKSGLSFESIRYNMTRKELDDLSVIEITPVSSHELKLVLTKYNPDIDHNNVLPFEKREMLIKLREGPDSLVDITTQRTVYSDTSYNSVYEDHYRIRNNYLVPLNENIQLTYDSEGEWIERKSKDYEIRRRFYSGNTVIVPEKTDGVLDVNKISFLYDLMDSLPGQAWENYENNRDSYQARQEIMENEEYGKSITITEAKNIEEFLPVLWYHVSLGSGYINGFDSLCYVAGYNTPVNDNGDNYRCLAVFEHSNGMFRLVKQSFWAIDPFYDSDEDLLFDGYDETNFSVDILDGNIVVNYEYMRGEAYTEYSFENGNWILVSYGSSHRTCCQAESISYDYRNSTYSYSLFNMGEPEEGDEDFPADTSYTEVREMPVIYMDDDSEGEIYY